MVVRTEMQMPNGTKIVIEGSEDEVIRIVASLQTRDKPALPEAMKKQKNRPKQSGPVGQTHHIKELCDDGFFSQPKGIADVKKALVERGHHYPVEHLSVPLIRLTQQRILRRFKEDGTWKYTTS